MWGSECRRVTADGAGVEAEMRLCHTCQTQDNRRMEHGPISITQAQITKNPTNSKQATSK